MILVVQSKHYFIDRFSFSMNEDDPTALEFTSLFENVQIQNFLQRHGLVRGLILMNISSIPYQATYGGIPLSKEEIEKRLQEIDDQSSVDIIAQSVIEKSEKPTVDHTKITSCTYFAEL
jgi:hypothetical protein